MYEANIVVTVRQNTYGGEGTHFIRSDSLEGPLLSARQFQIENLKINVTQVSADLTSLEKYTIKGTYAHRRGAERDQAAETLLSCGFKPLSQEDYNALGQ